MAETLVSPGVLARENDQSFVTQQPVTVGAAIVGPTVKGPVEIPTLVRSYSDYQNRFGTSFTSGSDTYSYFTSIAAQNYFVNGGETLLVTRVVSGSAGWDYADAYISGSNTSGSLWIETIDKGNLFNNANAITGTVSTWKSRNFVGSYGALTSGSTDNVRWETGKYYNNITSTDTQGLVGANYNNMVALMANQDDYRFNVITTPGLTVADNASQTTTLVNTIQSRGDAIAVVDTRPYGAQISQATTSAAANQ
jgi:hypothetical protein